MSRHCCEDSDHGKMVRVGDEWICVWCSKVEWHYGPPSPAVEGQLWCNGHNVYMFKDGTWYTLNLEHMREREGERCSANQETSRVDAKCQSFRRG